jgi:hypothetical protein
MQMANQDTAIQERAYAIWEQEGRPDGRDWEHWYQAAKEIAGPAPVRNEGAHATSKAKPRKTASGKGRLRDALRSALS